MRRKDKNGFTLVEVLIIVGIIGIMIAIVVPNLLSWAPNMRLKAAARDLYGAAMKAKSEAVKRNVDCALTFNQKVPTTGTTTYAYIVYEDADDDCQYDNGENIIAQMQQWPKGTTLDSTQGGGAGLTFPSYGSGNPTISFSPTSIPTTPPGGPIPNGSAFLININGRKASVVISRAGNISIN